MEEEEEFAISEEEIDIAAEEMEQEYLEENSEEEEENDADDGDNELERGLKIVWEKLSPPNLEKNIQNEWYGGIYKENKKEYLYIGKAIQRFLEDVDGPVTGIMLDCLKLKVGSGTVLESYGEGNRDVGFFSIYDIIAGPVTVELLKGCQWNVPDYNILKEKFIKVKSINRQELFLQTLNES